MDDPLIAVRMKYVEDLEDILECPICMKLPSGSIPMCTNGHHICQHCKNDIRMTNCPKCKTHFNGSRNYLAEKLALKFNEIKISILNPNHTINRKILTHVNSVETQTEVTYESASTQTNYTEATTETQTDFVGIVASTQTESQELHENSFHLCNNNNEICNSIISSIQSIHSPDSEVLISCLMKGCQCKYSINSIISHIKTNHKENLIEVIKSVNGLYNNVWSLEYELNKSFDYFLSILDMGCFYFTILIDPKGNLHGNIKILNDNYNGEQFYYVLLISNKKNPLISESFSGMVTPYLVLEEKNNQNHIFISNSIMPDYCLKETKSFECFLSLFKPEDSFEF